MDIMRALTGESWDQVGFSRLTTIELGGFEVEVLRQGFTGEHGYELSAAAEHGVELWDAIVEAGRGHDLGFLGNYTSRMTRVEAGLSLLHFDYHPAHDDVPGFQRHAQMDPAEHQCSPFELGLGHFVDLHAGAFIGKEALVAERDSDSMRWDFVGLVWNSDDVMASLRSLFEDGPTPAPIRFPHVLAPLAVPVLDGGERVGWATSVSYSPTVRRVISFGRVPRGRSDVGTRYQVLWGTDGGPQQVIGAEVVKLPFVAWKRAVDG
jgi:aminomethyltransferase